MRRDLISSALAIVLLTLALGLAYPLATTGVAQVLWPNKADGSPVRVDGRLAGSKLLGQPAKGARYFQARPSATGYSGSVTYFGNLGPNSRELSGDLRKNLTAYVRRERRYDRGLTGREVPADAVTDSASGVDPHISPANAAIQAHRIAAVRRMPMDRVRKLIDENTDGRGLGLFGEPGVNVLELNLALDRRS